MDNVVVLLLNKKSLWGHGTRVDVMWTEDPLDFAGSFYSLKWAERQNQPWPYPLDHSSLVSVEFSRVIVKVNQTPNDQV